MSLTRLRSFLFSQRQIQTSTSPPGRSMDLLWKPRLLVFSSESIALEYHTQHSGHRL